MNKTVPIKPLTGSDREMAEKLFSLLKERQLSTEQLQVLLPTTSDFLKSFSEVLRKETDNSHEEYKIS